MRQPVPESSVAPALPPLEHQVGAAAGKLAPQPAPAPPLHAAASAISPPPPTAAVPDHPRHRSHRQAVTPPLSQRREEGTAARQGPAVPAGQRREQRVAGAGAGGGVGRAGLALHIERQRNPRLIGAMAYAMPLLPALALLLRERRNRFVRAHAAQALVFFAVLALAQAAIYALLVVAGGLTTSLRAATVLAVVFALAWLALAALGFVAWTRLVAAALAGHVASLPLVTPLARRLLRGLDRIAGALGHGRND